MFCIHCGKENPTEASFCWNCGSGLVLNSQKVDPPGSTDVQDEAGQAAHPSPRDVFFQRVTPDGKVVPGDTPLTQDEVTTRAKKQSAAPKTGAPTPAAKNQSLWNPGAAAAWSVLFTPAFGAALHYFNWESLGDYEKAKLNGGWVHGWCIWTGILLVFPRSEIASYSLLVHIGGLVIWYFSTGKLQVDITSLEENKAYKKKPWLWPLVAGFSCTFLINSIVSYRMGR
jgi:hypothetical protein